MAQFSLLETTSTEPRRLPSNLRVLLLIARRAATEALRDRVTLIMSLFFAVILPLILVSAVLRPLAGDHTALARVIAIYVLIIGLMPASAAVGIAAGQFAGEKEQGNLTPLLASPASNLSIFAGKVFGAIAPSILFSLVAELTYLLCVALLLGGDALRLLPIGISLAMIALVPATSLFAAIVASLISSRVRTFNTAQQISGLALIPLWAVVIGLSFKLQDWGTL
ncbi:MAG TPA: ABC transporter permease, partial [Nitrolancea sp.]|nr:ABC transporter permease [Nitrolancea sp.]